MAFNPRAELEKAGQTLLDAAYQEQELAKLMEDDNFEETAEFINRFDDFDSIPDDEKDRARTIMESVKNLIIAKAARQAAVEAYATARRYVEAYETQSPFDEDFADIIKNFQVSDDEAEPRFTAGVDGTDDAEKSDE